MIAMMLIDSRDEILRIAAKYGAHDVRVFGSVARGEDSVGSDLDLLVEFEAGRSLLDHAGLVLELEALLGRPVDVGTPKGLRTRYRERILNEAVPL
jgi:predicted nucleotidyltransferase